MEPMTTAIGTLLLMKIAEGAATEAGKQIFEKVKGLLTPQLQEKATQLLRLLRLKSPETAKAIEQAPNPPLNIDITENELKQAVQNDSEVAKVVGEIDAVVKADPKLTQAVKEVIDDLKSQPPGNQSFTNIAEKIVNLAQGTGATINIQSQTIN
jgi:DNA-binding TFAR19-related protein (PDSD5 family)